MRGFKKRIQVVLSYGIVLLLAGGYPTATFAETSPVATTTVSPTASTTSTPTTTTPASTPAPTYTYDPATGRWNTNKWQYSAVTGQYEPVTATGPTAPTGPTTTPGPSTSTITPIASTTPATTPTTTSPTTSPTTSALSTTTQSPVPSTGTVTNTVSGTGTTNATTTNTIGNTVGSTSQSGNAAVSSNTAAGSATSGTAAASSTLMNTINSSVASGTGGLANFVANITGNVYGDIMLYPMMLGAMLSPSTSTTQTTNATVNATTNNQITNNVNLNATSGNATVANNTTAGNATTGTANTVADVMNIINSIVAANQSFVGTVNIYGNLNGDILIAPNFLPQLLASNAAASSNQTTNISSNVNIINTQAITNNVNLSAASGTATVAGNTSAGNATSGSANTNLVILNLTGHEIVASNSLLVFVNVLGKWIGVIVDAPTGATAAAIGNGVNQNTTANLDSVITAQTNTQITNNITLASQSGNAAVANNTNAGNATSGNATSSANILNMSQSSFGLTGWFGILFINVFGSWLGSFGVDTANGNAQPVASATNTAASATAQPLRVVQFIAKTPTGALSTLASNLHAAISDIGGTGSQPQTIDNGTQPAVLGANTASSPTSSTPTSSGLGLSAVVAMTMGAVVLLAVTLRNLWSIVYRRVSALVSSL